MKKADPYDSSGKINTLLLESHMDQLFRLLFPLIY